MIAFTRPPASPDHSVVAVGSIVTEDVPARTLVAGAPARPIRSLDIADGWRRE
jgi:acetyltransferase-like isoleucine patch superfamily enzyme